MLPPALDASSNTELIFFIDLDCAADDHCLPLRTAPTTAEIGDDCADVLRPGDKLRAGAEDEGFALDDPRNHGFLGETATGILPFSSSSFLRCTSKRESLPRTSFVRLSATRFHHQHKPPFLQSAYRRCVTVTSFRPFEEESLGILEKLFPGSRARVLAREASPSDTWESELPVRPSLPVLTRLRPDGSPVIRCPESRLEVLQGGPKVSFRDFGPAVGDSPH